MGTSLSILVVDDEPAVASAIAELLRSDGHEVATAGHGKEALDLAFPGRFQLVLSDLMMPVMAGDELLDALKARAGPPFWFVLMSSLSEPAVAARVQGYDRFLPKPIRPAAMSALTHDCAAALGDGAKLRQSGGPG